MKIDFWVPDQLKSDTAPKHWSKNWMEQLGTMSISSVSMEAHYPNQNLVSNKDNHQFTIYVNHKRRVD
jgi:hypothetical protein